MSEKKSDDQMGIEASLIDQRESGGVNILTQPIEASSEYERLLKFLIKFFPGKKREVLLNKPVGQKLKEMLFFVRRQKQASVAIAAQGDESIYKLLEILDDNFLAPPLHLLWGKNGKNLDTKNSLILLREHIQEHRLHKVDKILPVFIPKTDMQRDQRRIASFILGMKSLFEKVRFMIFTDEDLRLLITSEYKDVRQKYKGLNEEYFNAWQEIVESPSIELCRDAEGKRIVPNYPVPFTNFYDDAFLLRGQVMKPGDLHSAREFNPDVHVTITGILGRMGLHRQHLTSKVKYEGINPEKIHEESKANFLFYTLYYAHLNYITRQRDIPSQLTLTKEGHKRLADTSPVPIRIFIIARLVAKYHLPVHVLFSMIETLETAYAKFHAEGAKEKFKKILKMALAMARVGRKRGDYSLVLGRTFLFETERDYLRARAELKRKASEDETLKETLVEDEKELSRNFQAAAMRKYMENLSALIQDDHAAFDFYINGMLVRRFKRFYPSFPELYAEWLVSEFADLSAKLKKTINNVEDEAFAEAGLLPTYILKELGFYTDLPDDYDPYQNSQKMMNVLEDAPDPEEAIQQLAEATQGKIEDDSGLIDIEAIDMSLDLDEAGDEGQSDLASTDIAEDKQRPTSQETKKVTPPSRQIAIPDIDFIDESASANDESQTARLTALNEMEEDKEVGEAAESLSLSESSSPMIGEKPASETSKQNRQVNDMLADIDLD